MPKRDENGGFWFTTDTGVHVYCEEGQSKEDAIKERFGDRSGAKSYGEWKHEKMFESRDGFRRNWDDTYFTENPNPKYDKSMDDPDYDEGEDDYWLNGSYEDLLEKAGRSVYDVMGELEAERDKISKNEYITNKDVWLKNQDQKIEGFKKAVNKYLKDRNTYTDAELDESKEEHDKKARKNLKDHVRKYYTVDWD